MLHKSFTKRELERMSDAELHHHPDVIRFLQWIAGKDPDFHAPTRKRR